MSVILDRKMVSTHGRLWNSRQAPYLVARFRLTTSSCIAAPSGEVTRQAAMVAHIADFALMTIVTIGSVALLLLVRLNPRAAGGEEAVVFAPRTVRPGCAG